MINVAIMKKLQSEITSLKKENELYKAANRTLVADRLIHPVKTMYHGRYTIVFWSDHTKTVVRCHKDDAFDREKGFLLAFCKKHCYNKVWYMDMIRRFTEGTGVEELDIVKENLGDESSSDNCGIDNIPSDIHDGVGTGEEN